MEDQVFEFVEIERSLGNHKLYFKPTGELLCTFVNRWEALRAAVAIDKAAREKGMLNGCWIPPDIRRL